jgi:hypothetical protein
VVGVQVCRRCLIERCSAVLVQTLVMIEHG